MTDASDGNRDFFISHTGADKAWAEWIAWELEAAGYTVFVQEWDFRPGQNFVDQMQQGASACARTVAILTPAYFESGFTRAEWYSAFAKDPTGKAGLLLPVRVRECDVDGLLGQIIYIDLAGLDETQARERLLAGIGRTRAKPTRAPTFPKPALPTTPPSVANGSDLVKNEEKKRTSLEFERKKSRTLDICAEHISKFQSYLSFLADIERRGIVTDQDEKDIEDIALDVSHHYDDKVVSADFMQMGEDQGFAPATHSTYQYVHNLCKEVKHLVGCESEDDVRNFVSRYQAIFRHKLTELNDERMKIARTVIWERLFGEHGDQSTPKG